MTDKSDNEQHTDFFKSFVTDSANKTAVPSQNSINDISGDYWNEYAGLLIKLEYFNPTGPAKLQVIADYFKKKSILSYEKRYPNCDNVMTEKSLKSIKKLDELAEKANGFTDPSKFSEKEFETLINEVFKIVCPWEKESYFSRRK